MATEKKNDALEAINSKWVDNRVPTLMNSQSRNTNNNNKTKQTDAVTNRQCGRERIPVTERRALRRASGQPRERENESNRETRGR